jgi:hypothetical protein
MNHPSDLSREIGSKNEKLTLLYGASSEQAPFIPIPKWIQPLFIMWGAGVRDTLWLLRSK